jgi:hypothetical protein
MGNFGKTGKIFLGSYFGKGIESLDPISPKLRLVSPKGLMGFK